MGAAQTAELVPDGDPRRITFTADGCDVSPRSESQTDSAKSTPTKAASPGQAAFKTIDGREIPFTQGPAAPRQLSDASTVDVEGGEADLKRSMATAFGAPATSGQNRRTVSSGGAFQFAWEELASSQKKLAAEKAKLAEAQKELELERQALAEERKRLDEDRAALEAERRAFLLGQARKPNLSSCDSGKLHQVSENLLDLSPQPEGFDSPSPGNYETKGPSGGKRDNPPRPCVGDMGLIGDEEIKNAGLFGVRKIEFKKETSSGTSESTRSPRSSRGVSYDESWTAETHPEAASLSKENLEKLWL